MEMLAAGIRGDLMLRVVVLGSAAGGGIPQWNCGCAMCRAARDTRPDLQSGQASIAVSTDNQNWFLINASPDLRQQVTDTAQLHPAPGQLRHSPIAGVILTNGEVDAVAGLLSMREGSPFTIYGHERVLAILRDNSIFNVLYEKNVKREAIAIDTPFAPKLQDGSPSGLDVTAFTVPGKSAWYLEGTAHPAGGDRQTDVDGDTLGLRIAETATGKHFYFIAACARVTPELKARINGAPLLFFDGTVWRDDEMIVAGLSQKTGASMGHIAMSGEHGAVAALADANIARKFFLHINNSNPALLHDSPERAALTTAGWQIPGRGMEITL
jgi:pyrroloquinoline quinone biosynthesis protein B